MVSGIKRFFKIGETDEESDEESEKSILGIEDGYIAEYDYETGVARIREKKAEKVTTKEEKIEKGWVDIGNFKVGDV